MGIRRFQETGLLSEAQRHLGNLLPLDWSSVLDLADPEHGTDAVLHLAGPQGERASLTVAVKRWSTAPTTRVRGVLEPLARKSQLPVLLVTDYINQPLRAVCDDLGINYADATGWVSITVADPLVVLRSSGADRPPRARGASSTQRLSGESASQVIEELLALDPPVGVRELAGRTGVSPGSVSKLLPTLAAAGAVERDDHGRVSLIRKRPLLDRWMADYSFLRSNKGVTHLLYPRGVPQLLRLAQWSDLLVTGSAAAAAFLPVGVVPIAPVGKVLAYAAVPAHQVATALGAIPIEPAAANLIVAGPNDLLALRGGQRPDGLATVGLGRMLADARSMKGRDALVADQVIDYLALTDRAWHDG